MNRLFTVIGHNLSTTIGQTNILSNQLTMRRRSISLCTQCKWLTEMSWGKIGATNVNVNELQHERPKLLHFKELCPVIEIWERARRNNKTIFEDASSIWFDDHHWSTEWVEAVIILMFHRSLAIECNVNSCLHCLLSVILQDKYTATYSK